jgi:hypothetical protein
VLTNLLEVGMEKDPDFTIPFVEGLPWRAFRGGPSGIAGESRGFAGCGVGAVEE